MAYQPNPGRIPEQCLVRDQQGFIAGYRPVMVKLFNGITAGPWPSAGGRPPTRWSISKTPHPFEIESFEVIR